MLCFGFAPTCGEKLEGVPVPETMTSFFRLSLLGFFGQRIRRSPTLLRPYSASGMVANVTTAGRVNSGDWGQLASKRLMKSISISDKKKHYANMFDGECCRILTSSYV